MKAKYTKNCIDKMKIEKQEKKCFFHGINNNFGTDFENNWKIYKYFLNIKKIIQYQKYIY